MHQEATIHDLHTRRDQVRGELETNDRHMANVLRHPERELESAPVGDVLTWCEGIDDALATAVLSAAGLNWGKRLALLSQRDITAVCWAIRNGLPDVWERWRQALESRRAAA